MLATGIHWAKQTTGPTRTAKQTKKANKAHPKQSNQTNTSDQRTDRLTKSTKCAPQSCVSSDAAHMIALWCSRACQRNQSGSDALASSRVRWVTYSTGTLPTYGTGSPQENGLPGTRPMFCFSFLFFFLGGNVESLGWVCLLDRLPRPARRPKRFPAPGRDRRVSLGQGVSPVVRYPGG